MVSCLEPVFNYAYTLFMFIGDGKYLVEDIDSTLCTHIMYSFVVLDPATYLMKIDDPSLNIDRGNIKKFVRLKKTNPNTKLLLALGGWEDSGTSKYSTLLADDSKRLDFILEDT